jgi:hypothetical protein
MDLTPEELAKMPADVRARFDAAHEQLQAMQGPAPEAGGETAPADPAEAPETPAAEVIALEPAETAPAPEQTPEPPAADRLAHLEQSFKTLQGKYSAEVPRYAEQLRERDRELAELRQQLAEAKPAPAQPEGRKAKYGLTDEQIETYGEDLVALAEQVADRIVDERLAKSVQPIEQRLRASAQEAFAARLETLVPGMGEINADPAFAAWLGETDPFSGQTRRELADAAIAAMDAQRTARFFTAFLDQNKPIHTAAPSAPVAPPRPATPSLAAQVMPRPSAPLPQAPAKPVYTLAQYNEAMTLLTKGGHSAQEAEQIRNEFIAAFAEGRVLRT